ncbi:MAG: glycerophosphodiester phosphodiesterase family protein [Novosphingobium sp.]|uniref:glycerophosphodiester phosphodiesterase family protein n=1 Tax=Novosphingobium sp. TaxID=1874826 RepID=UPI003017995A
MIFNTSCRAAMVLSAVLGMVMTAAPAAASPTRPSDTLVFAHRGTSALRPEETLTAFEKAIAEGADYIEPDLVPTKDGVLVARHENNLTETTDVSAHPEFAARKTVKMIDGESREGWFTEDFTLAELKTLRAKERLGALRPESMSYDGKFEIATFDEIVALAASRKTTKGNPVGLIPEIKHSTYFAGLGFDMEGKLIAAIKASAYLQSAPLIIQSFEVTGLKRLHKELAGMANVALMQLMGPDAKSPADVVKARGKLTFGVMMTPKGLAEVSKYAQWVATELRRILTLKEGGMMGPRTPVLADAHRADLKIATFTFRPENRFLPIEWRYGEPDARWPRGMYMDIVQFLGAGVDGIFVDDAGVARAAVDGIGVDKVH